MNVNKIGNDDSTLINPKTNFKTWNILPKQTNDSLNAPTEQHNEKLSNQKKIVLEEYSIKYLQYFDRRIKLLQECVKMFPLKEHPKEESNFAEIYWEFKITKEIEYFEKNELKIKGILLEMCERKVHIVNCQKRDQNENVPNNRYCSTCEYYTYRGYSDELYKKISNQLHNLQQKIIHNKKMVKKYSEDRSLYFLEINNLLKLNPKLSMFRQQYFILNDQVPEFRIFFFHIGYLSRQCLSEVIWKIIIEYMLDITMSMGQYLINMDDSCKIILKNIEDKYDYRAKDKKALKDVINIAKKSVVRLMKVCVIENNRQVITFD